ncbi:Uncharacterised protein [Mycobacteroides abscessus subsp. abscessus]|nr:Uncharacterised protein [Mycobacteroides abscessus subsp. abscessus]
MADSTRLSSALPLAVTFAGNARPEAGTAGRETSATFCNPLST